VGIPGITYKYLGLRIFAHPWSGMTEQLPSDLKTALSRIGEFNNTLQERAAALGGQKNEFNLTLINEMPAMNPTMKKDKHYKMGQTAVNWHADSCLQDNSTIAVYQLIPKPKGRQKKRKREEPYVGCW
jgi:hypothetical protein